MNAATVSIAENYWTTDNIVPARQILIVQIVHDTIKMANCSSIWPDVPCGQDERTRLASFLRTRTHEEVNAKMSKNCTLLFVLLLLIVLLLLTCTFAAAQDEYCAQPPYRVTRNCSSTGCQGSISYFVAPPSGWGGVCQNPNTSVLPNFCDSTCGVWRAMHDWRVAQP